MKIPDDRRISMLIKVAALFAFYATATLIGAFLFVMFLRSGAFIAIDVLFYRGLSVLTVCGIFLLAILWILAMRLPKRFGITARDAFSGTAVSLPLLLTVFVLGPVTFDRSISIFILSQFERADVPLTQEAARNAFTRIYVNEWDQIGRRLHEQEISGNLERTPQGWQLTARGHVFMEAARAISLLSGGDLRFVGASVTPSDHESRLKTCTP